MHRHCEWNREKRAAIFNPFMVNKTANCQGNRKGIGLSTRMQSKKIRPRRHQAFQHSPRQWFPAPHLWLRPQPFDQHHRQQPLLLRRPHRRRLLLPQIRTNRPHQQLLRAGSPSPRRPAHPEMGRLFLRRHRPRISHRKVAGAFSEHVDFSGDSGFGKVGQKRVWRSKSIVGIGWPCSATRITCQERGARRIPLGARLYREWPGTSTQNENGVGKFRQDWIVRIYCDFLRWPPLLYQSLYLRRQPDFKPDLEACLRTRAN